MSKHLLLVTVSVWLLSGCGSITIDAPKGNLPAAPSPVSVPVQIEITKSVYNRNFVITGGAAPITLTNFTTTPSGTQNLDILSTAVQLAPGSYTLTASGTYDQWNNTPQSLATSSNFTVSALVSVSLSLAPPGDILVVRGSTNSGLSFNITRTGVTGPAALSASNLPAGVSFSASPNPIPATATASTGTLVASATAHGSAPATFKAAIGNVDDSPGRTVVVVPVPGTVAWVSAPFLTSTGIPTVTSPDGKFTASGSRTGASRVWTLHIAPTSGSATPIDVNAAQWGGAGGSNLVGLAFCPSTTSGTLSALILSDEDENPVTTGHANGVTYRLKVVRFDSGAPVLVNDAIDGLFFLSGTQPKLGFSPDCSIVGGWTIDMQGSNNRITTFMDIFNGMSTQPWSYTDTATSPPATLAKISAATITLTPPTGSVSTRAVP